ncbi:MAG: hypothetical protein VX615_04790 [Planctomycetota bacterium]|nr:hypothetical protein [Planctomycetota bacterium]
MTGCLGTKSLRLIIEHPLPISISIAIVAIVFLWKGMTDGVQSKLITGLCILGLAIGCWCIGKFIDTPSEHARRIVKGFVTSVEEGRTIDALGFVSKDVMIIDDWEGEKGGGKVELRAALERLQDRYKLSHSTILQLTPYEREGDVQVELSLFVRVSGIGSVPSKWRIIVGEIPDEGWSIWSIDALEVAGRKLR